VQQTQKKTLNLLNKAVTQVSGEGQVLQEQDLTHAYANYSVSTKNQETKSGSRDFLEIFYKRR
jgi:hypothetical protein